MGLLWSSSRAHRRGLQMRSCASRRLSFLVRKTGVKAGMPTSQHQVIVTCPPGLAPEKSPFGKCHELSPSSPSWLLSVRFSRTCPVTWAKAQGRLEQNQAGRKGEDHVPPGEGGYLVRCSEALHSQGAPTSSGFRDGHEPELSGQLPTPEFPVAWSGFRFRTSLVLVTDMIPSEGG
ncbi:hypothetical protein H920_05080 [Fukomys damarensis]|uniref:Uncharacterized protein n=1 Tax=Fukomys damarensis TaxID=885580 RepID=A0A091DST0_FUKDA|nr:hypothetical protein H920_05080 [Fukomys damarensis]